MEKIMSIADRKRKPRAKRAISPVEIEPQQHPTTVRFQNGNVLPERAPYVSVDAVVLEYKTEFYDEDDVPSTMKPVSRSSLSSLTSETKE